MTMDRADAIAQLQRVPLFSGLTKKELRLAARFLRERRFLAGSAIVVEGQPGYGLYVLQDGRASVRRKGRTVARMGPGDFFGEMAVLDDGPRTATVYADTDTVCLTLASREVKTLLSDQPGMAYKMLQEVVRRVRQASSEVSD